MYRGHTHVWSTITSECVGCTACGVVHVCSSSTNIVPCAIEQQDDSSCVCTYTGIVVSSTSFFDPEASIAEYNAGHFHVHVDQHQHSRPNRTPSLMQKIEVLDRMMSSIVDLLFFSKQAQHARETERLRFNRKIASVFTAHVSRSRNSFAPCSIIDGIETCIESVSSYRRPIQHDDIPPVRHFTQLKRIIVELLSRIELPRQYIFTEQNEKMRNLIISLVYISSDGISFDGHVYLPKFPGLKKILPLELVLFRCFGIQPKIVTDGENVIKMSIKDPKNSHFDAHNMRTNGDTADPSRVCNFATTNICTCTETSGTNHILLHSPLRPSSQPVHSEHRPAKIRRRK